MCNAHSVGKHFSRWYERRMVGGIYEAPAEYDDHQDDSHLGNHDEAVDER